MLILSRPGLWLPDRRLQTDLADWLLRDSQALTTASLVNQMLMGSGGAQTGKQVFVYAGADQSITVPWGVYFLAVKLWGGGGCGGKGLSAMGGNGGPGGYTAGILAVTPGQVLTMMVGKGGIMSAAPSYGGGGHGTGTYNGQGGGRSAIRSGGVDIATAGGGGAGAGNSIGNGNGGSGGGANGADATSPGSPGHGGTQSAGGAAGGSGAAGSQYQGGNGQSGEVGAGGGGGYYGGGGGGLLSSQQGGGAGGSGYVGSMTSASTVQGAGTTPSGTGDGDYQTGIGIGGVGGNGTYTPGGDGRIVIIW